MSNRGPAPLPPHEKRTHRFHVYVNEIELDRLEAVVGHPGLADLVRVQSSQRKGMRVVADLMRAKLLAHRAPVYQVVPEVNQTTAADLGRVGNNVNQLAHHLNVAALTGKLRDDAEAILADLQQLRDALEDALLGIATRNTPRPKLKDSFVNLEDF